MQTRTEAELIRTRLSRLTVGRTLQALAIAGGQPLLAAEFIEHKTWSDRTQILSYLKAAQTPFGTADFSGALAPVRDAFLGAMRPYSVPLMLRDHMRLTPNLTRLFVNQQSITAVEVAEFAPIPASAGNWAEITLRPRKFASLQVQTNELIKTLSATASLALADDQAEATAESLDRAFIDPELEGSILYGASHFTGAGGTIANIDADLKKLIDLVPGAYRPGTAFVMTSESATYLSLLRGTGGARAYEDITPQGGYLLGLPVIVTSAAQQIGSPPTRIIALISPSDILFSDEVGVQLAISDQASLQMDGAPTSNPANMTSLFQAHSTALRAIIEADWYAKAGSAAYFIAGF